MNEREIYVETEKKGSEYKLFMDGVFYSTIYKTSK